MCPGLVKWILFPALGLAALSLLVVTVKWAIEEFRWKLLPRANSVVVTVLSPDGSPFQGAVVEASNTYPQSGVTDRRGEAHFRITNQCQFTMSIDINGKRYGDVQLTSPNLWCSGSFHIVVRLLPQSKEK